MNSKLTGVLIDKYDLERLKIIAHGTYKNVYYEVHQLDSNISTTIRWYLQFDHKIYTPNDMEDLFPTHKCSDECYSHHTPAFKLNNTVQLWDYHYYKGNHTIALDDIMMKFKINEKYNEYYMPLNQTIDVIKYNIDCLIRYQNWVDSVIHPPYPHNITMNGESIHTIKGEKVNQ